ncbi:MAG: GFA family protein [Candidatus Binatia bacterium]
MSRASCLCGDVVWELPGPYAFMHHCHCGRCRKAHGTPFATYVGAPQDGFRLEGAARVATWQGRSFCRGCGSVVPGPPVQGLVFAPAGNFDGDPGARPDDHIFVASKAPWYEIADALPRFDAYPPGVDAAVLPDPPRSAPPPGVTRGSCLCGAVAFAIDAPPLFARNCHCGRCRRARSAAHASNLAVPADGLRITRGADRVATYKIPAADRFAQAFCRACGSPLPCVYAKLGIAVVPMGGLDDPPAVRPGCHIFVASKAPWFAIADHLPQHDEYPPAA